MIRYFHARFVGLKQKNILIAGLSCVWGSVCAKYKERVQIMLENYGTRKEDAEKKECEVEELATTIERIHKSGKYDYSYKSLAQNLINAGWSKKEGKDG